MCIAGIKKPATAYRCRLLTTQGGLFATDGAVADVLAVEAAVPADLFCQLVGVGLRFGHAITQCSGTEYTAATVDDLAILEAGTGLEHLAVQLGGVIQAADHLTLEVVVSRIAAGGQYHAEAGARVPQGFDLVQRT